MNVIQFVLVNHCDRCLIDKVPTSPTHSDLSYLGFAVGQEDKEKLLHEAAKLGDVERVVELLKEGVHISYKDNLGYSALHWASLYGHLHVCTLLYVNLFLPLLYLEESFFLLS